MKLLKDHPIRTFLTASTLVFLLAAVLCPDRAQMFSGLVDILMSPAQITKDYFIIGSVSGTFLNVGLVMAVFTAMLYIPGTVSKGSTVAAYFLTAGFSTWGINLLNIWPFILGVLALSLVKRKPFSQYVDLAMFSTALCPLVSELLLRYPSDEVHNITAGSILLALVVGMAVGFLTPAMAAHSPNLHKGFDLYSAALPGGLLGFFLVAMLYKTAKAQPNLPTITPTLGEGRPEIVWTFCGIFFGLCVLAGFLLNGKSFKGYGALLKDSGHKVDFTAKYGPGLAIMNVGVYGLFIVAYYIAVGGSFNGVTLGIIFCMVCFGAAGAHPGNVWPIMLGYILAAQLGFNAVNVQSILIGLCFASGLAPISGVYGWWAGVIGGAAHYILVTSVPPLHGGFCLYNGGFTALLVAVILVPQLESFCKTKAERRLSKEAARK